jgi:peptide/nickel transport system permease protein
VISVSSDLRLTEPESVELALDPAHGPATRRRRSRRTPVSVWLAAAFLLLLLVAVVFPGWLARSGPLYSDIGSSLKGPSGKHWFGTDQIGRDVYSRVVYGARYSLLIGIVAMAISLVGGLVLGLLAGLGGRVVDEVVSRVLDILSSIPGILLAILIVAFTHEGVANVAVAVGIASIPRFGRVIRAQVFVVKRSDYVRHSVVYGRSRWRVVASHVVPNVLTVVPVLATLDIGTSIMASSGLSFVGLGPKPPTPEWGVMLSDSLDTLSVAWWAGVFPGLALTASVIAFTTVGRELQRRVSGRQR